MTSLIKRLESLTSPDREVDAEIAKAIGWESVPWEFAGRCGLTWYAPLNSVGRPQPQNYTGSIDAALTLVPEGCVWALNFASMATIMKVGTKKFDIIDGVIVGQWPENQREGELPVSVAIALCIAALKAREADNAD